MAGQFKMDDYVDVAQRIADFYKRFPDGSLRTGTPPQVVDIGGKPFIWYHAQAFRSADDPMPGDGWAAEPVPGPTQFTLNSELMNAETAAWGRAIVSLGFSTKKIASQQEVRARQADSPPPTQAKPKAAPKPVTPSLETLQDRLLEIVAQADLNVPEWREKIKAQTQRPDFKVWLERQIAAGESSLALRAEQEQADREAAVESDKPKFEAPTGRRGEKAAA